MRNNSGSRRATLQDIARHTGYSATAVSRALRGMPDIGPEATRQIRQAASELGYVPNQTAASLRNGRTHIITLILAHMSNPFFSVMTDLIQIAAQAAGYSLMVLCSRGDPELERKLVTEAVSRRVDGVLLFPICDSAASIAALRAAGTPFVLLSGMTQPGLADCVVCDDREGGRLAAAHLIEAGHRKLAMVSAFQDSPPYAPRREGFLRACDEAGIPESDRRCAIIPGLSVWMLSHEGDGWLPGMEKSLLELREAGFDGLFVYCDVEAWHLLTALRSSPRLSPEDFGVVGFDNIDNALASPIPLCSVDCDVETLARRGVALLLERIHGDDRPPQTILCPVRIVCRGSCR